MYRRQVKDETCISYKQSNLKHLSQQYSTDHKCVVRIREPRPPTQTCLLVYGMFISRPYEWMMQIWLNKEEQPSASPTMLDISKERKNIVHNTSPLTQVLFLLLAHSPRPSNTFTYPFPKPEVFMFICIHLQHLSQCVSLYTSPIQPINIFPIPDGSQSSRVIECIGVPWEILGLGNNQGICMCTILFQSIWHVLWRVTGSASSMVSSTRLHCVTPGEKSTKIAQNSPFGIKIRPTISTFGDVMCYSCDISSILESL